MSFVRQLDLDLPVEEPEFIAGLFPKKQLSAVASAPGIGKTWFVTRLLMELSAGGTIFDELSFNEPERKVMVFAGETGFDMILQRAKLLGLNWKQENTVIISAREAAKEKILLLLNERVGQENFRKLFSQYKPDIAFFDTFISFHTVDESSMAELSRVLNFLIMLAEENDTSIVLMHHTRKRSARDQNKMMTQDELIGSSALMRMMALILGIERHKGQLLVKCQKSWYKEPEPFRYKIISNAGGSVELKTDFSSFENGDLNLAERIRRLVDGNRGNYLTIDSIAQALHIKRATSGNAISRELEYLEEDGSVTRIRPTSDSQLYFMCN